MLQIHCVGTRVDPLLAPLLNDYLKRLTLKLHWHKTLDHLARALPSQKPIVCLDPAGPLLTSGQFHQTYAPLLSQLHFIIGPAEGLPSAFKAPYPLLSLSPLTFPHQLAILLLVEQIYRASQIEKGTAYHK